MAVAHRLTERDRAILTMIYRQRVFTTDQLADVLRQHQHRTAPLDHALPAPPGGPFPAHRPALRVGAIPLRARPAGRHGGGGRTGQGPRQDPLAIREGPRLGRSQRLAHLVGTNAFFSALMAEGRRRDDCALSLWWSERYCATNFNEIARPDGLGIWQERDTHVIFCLEYDRSTETLERLEKKLKSYEDLQVASGSAYWILFCFGHPRRESGARRVLAEATVPVATAALGANTAAARGDLGAHWLRMPDAPG